jgi:hypothetical protein
MKKVVLFLVMASNLLVANAQKNENVGFEKGNILLSGALSFSSRDNAGENSSEFKVTPNAGFFLTDKILFGINVGIGSLTQTADKLDSSGNRIGSLTTKDQLTSEFGVFLRYYFTPNKTFSFFSQFGANYKTTNDKIAKVRNNEISMEISPGMNYFLSEKVSIQANLGKLSFSNSKSDLPGSKADNSFGIDLNLTSISFGLNYKL